MSKKTNLTIAVTMALASMVAGCKESHSTAHAPQAGVPAAAHALDQSLQPVAGVKDVMQFMVDPAANFLWQAVGTTTTDKGTEDKQPRTDEDWNEVRRQAVILTEAANLLMIEGRHVASEDGHAEKEVAPGNLSSEQAEAAIAKDRAGFNSYAKALRDSGLGMLKAADARDVDALVDRGNAVDEACEACHTHFWYPSQSAAGAGGEQATVKVQ